MARASPKFGLCLLGSFRLERNSQTIHLPTRKVESLFAYLVLYPEQHSREKLAAQFWGDVPDTLARGSLRKALTLLRKQIGDEILFADRETVQMNPNHPIRVDVRELLQTAETDPQSAVSLYAGDLLPDFYDDWIAPERERYRTLYIEILLRLTEEMRAQSGYVRAIEYAAKF